MITISNTGTLISVLFSSAVSPEGIADLSNYSIQNQQGVAIRALSIKIYNVDPLDPTTNVNQVDLEINKPTNSVQYRLTLSLPGGAQTAAFTASSQLPTLDAADMGDEGQITLTFSEIMAPNSALTGTSSYALSPTTRIKRVSANGPYSVVLHTVSLLDVSYNVTVNGVQDFVGNPIDIGNNTQVFVGIQAKEQRSIFTNHGPITKPKLTIQSGSTASITKQTQVSLPGAVIAPAHVGLYIELSGTHNSRNDGRFQIVSRVSNTIVRLSADLHNPETNNGSIAWKLVDMRNGMIADDPTDVTVRINGSPVVPEEVVGLLGQVVLATAPGSDDSVEVDYNWIDDPHVWFYRTNSREFLLNYWDLRSGGDDGYQHHYAYKAGLTDPDAYITGDLVSATDQPLLRDLKYRGYEREYSVGTNDPNTLLTNAPLHKVAYPQLERPLETVAVSYNATVVPELDDAQWIRYGTGTAVINSGGLVVTDTTSSTGLYWTRDIDLTSKHVFAMAWRLAVQSVTALQGVFTGVAAGYSDQQRVLLVGYLNDSGTKKIGVLRDPYGNDPSTIAAWIGGFDPSDTPTNAPIAFDWNVETSYRIFRDTSGKIEVFVDGGIIPVLKVQYDSLPLLSSLTVPFDQIQGVVFGSVSVEAESTSKWDFVRYTAIPVNAVEVAPSIFVDYESNEIPEVSTDPWTPIGFHGTETVASSALILDSTSGSDFNQGLVNGAFRGFFRIEPLLSAAYDVTLDFNLGVLTSTQGLDPDALMVAIDDGDRLMQLSFISDTPSPLISYGGRVLPQDFTPYVWGESGIGSVSMLGRYLTVNNNVEYKYSDIAAPTDDARVISSFFDWIAEARLTVVSHTANVSTHFAGASVDCYDSLKDVGFRLLDESGVFSVELHSNGVGIAGGKFSFSWNDGKPHTYRIVKSTSGTLVSLFIDNTFRGSLAYTLFNTPVSSNIGSITFGSSDTTITSNVQWQYCNAWRVTSGKRYIGLWRGTEEGSLLDYHLPLRVDRSTGITSPGNVLTDSDIDFVSSGVQVGDVVLVRSGANKGVYAIQSVTTNTLTVGVSFVGATDVDYEIAYAIDWAPQTRYRIMKTSDGSVIVYLGTSSIPTILVDYINTELPANTLGLPSKVANGLPAIVWGAFSGGELSSTKWDYLKYGAVSSITGQGIETRTIVQNLIGYVPPGGMAPDPDFVTGAPGIHHQVNNQRNVISSFEHHQTSIAHSHTDFWSESEGIPPQTEPDLLRDPTLFGFTRLNEGTPLMPLTQNYDTRNPQPVKVLIGGLNDPNNVINDPGFLSNDSQYKIEIQIPDNVLYNQLQVIESSAGFPSLLQPAYDQLVDMEMQLTNETCNTYSGSNLPENDLGFVTPWEKVSDNPTHQSALAAPNELTYSTDSTGTRTAYINRTLFTTSPSLHTEVKFRMRVVSDSSLALGDSQIRIGATFSGISVALGFVTFSSGPRYVVVIDLASNKIVAGMEFDYLDQQYHDYRIVKTPGHGKVYIAIDNGVLENMTEEELFDGPAELPIPFGGGWLVP